MSKFQKKRGKTAPKVSTASLPDIIFILLFFFMVVTVMKESDLKVQVIVPEATELQKLEKKSLVSYLYIGRPTAKYESIYGSAPRLQLNDKISKKEDITLFLEQEKLKVQEALHPFMTASLRVDGEVTMGIVSDVKTELRKAGQLKVNYSSRRRAKDLK